MLLHRTYTSCKSQHSVAGSRYAAVRPGALPVTHTQHFRGPTVTRSAASIENASVTSGSKCPFAGASASTPARARTSSLELSKLHGAGWSCLPDGNTANLPQPQGKLNLNPLQFIMGDFPELQQGEAPFMLERFRLFGPVFKWKLGNETVVAVLDHDTVKSLLQADGKVISFWSPPALQAFQGEASRKNMETPSARMAQRKTLAPGFSRQALRQVLGKVEAICAHYLDTWSAAGEAIDLTKEGRELSFDFSTKLLVNFDVPEEQRPEIKAKLEAMFKAQLAPPVKLPGTTFTKGVRAKAELVEQIKQIIQMGNSNTDALGHAEGSSAFELILQALKENQKQGEELTDEEIAEAGINLLLAGTDTSGAGSQAAMAILSLFPEVMDKLRQEQQRVIAEFGPEMTLPALDSMQYAEAVIKEALRLAPPAGAVLRKALVDLEIGGKFVPAGSLLYLSTFIPMNISDRSLHPDTQGIDNVAPQDLEQLKSTWKQINYEVLKTEFHPERWLKQDTEAAKSSGLLTFSVGPHTCLGMSLFMTEAKVLLAMLARGYDLKAESPQELAFAVTITAQLNRDAGSRVRFTKLPAAVAADSRVPAGAAA